MTDVKPATDSAAIITVDRIREIEMATLKRKKVTGSGQASQPSDGSLGKSLTSQASAANRRALVLKERIEGLKPEDSSYATSLKRLKDLQGAPGLLNILTTGISISVKTANPPDKFTFGEDEIYADALNKGIEKFKDPNNFSCDPLSTIASNLEDLADEVGSSTLYQEVCDLRADIDNLRASVFNEKNIDNLFVWDCTQSSPSYSRPSELCDFERKTQYDSYVNSVRPCANAFVCAEMDSNATQAFKDSVIDLIKKSWKLAHAVEHVAGSRTNMKIVDAKVNNLKASVARILKLSDIFLIKEYEKLQEAQKN